MSLHEYPKKPGISRFVAPWDTSGWYFMAEHFAPGCRIYSNSTRRWFLNGERNAISDIELRFVFTFYMIDAASESSCSFHFNTDVYWGNKKSCFSL